MYGVYILIAGHINPNIISLYKGFLDLFNKIHPKALLFPARLLTDNVLLFVCALENSEPLNSQHTPTFSHEATSN